MDNYRITTSTSPSLYDTVLLFQKIVAASKNEKPETTILSNPPGRDNSRATGGAAATCFVPRFGLNGFLGGFVDGSDFLDGFSSRFVRPLLKFMV